MMRKPILFRKTWLLAGGAAFAASGMPAAFAQEAANGQVEEIVVTAQKRGENIQEVPSGVTALPAQLLKDLHATQLTDIGSYVPAFEVDSAGSPGQTSLSIRGIAPIGRGATVATYIDDAPIGSSSSYGGGNSFQLDLLPYDVQRVEVLRGPQGTLYGASSMGGLLKYVLTDPSLDSFTAHIGGDLFGMSHADKPGGGFRGTVSAPIVDGQLGITASYAREDTPGFIDNAATGEKGQNGVEQQSGRIGLVWLPIDDLKIKFNALYQEVKAAGDANVALDSSTLQPLGGKLADNNLTSQPFQKQIQYYSLSLNYTLPWAELVSASTYSNTRTSQPTDASYTYGVAFPFFGLPAGASQYKYALHLQKFTQEVRLQSLPGTQLEWLGGVFFTYENSKNFQSPSALTITGVPIPGFDPLFVGSLPSTYNEYAAFGSVTYHVTDAFEILAGMRYSENNQVFSEIGSGPLVGNISLLDQKSHEGVATFSVGAKYHISDDVMTYFRIASGYQPGGPNLAVNGIPPTFHSDTLTNYEIGVKSEFLDHRLLLDVDAFYIDWNDIQLLSNGAGFNYVLNGGSAKSQGIEANASLRPINGLTLDATLAYIDSTLTKDVPEIGGLNGDRLPYVPRLSGSFRATYSQPVYQDWVGSAGLGVRVEGQRVSDVSSAYDTRSLPAYAALDLNAGISNDRYTLQLFAKNVTDTRAYLSYTPLVNQATGALTQIEGTVLQPRSVGISVDAKF